MKVQARYDLFAREYVIDLNGTRAAIAAGYSESTATEQASRLLTKSNVKRIVDRLLAKRASKLDVTADRIIEELAKLAFFDPRKIYDADGALIPVKDWDDYTAAALAGIEHDKLFEHFGQGNAKHVGTTTKVKLLARTEALKLLGQYRKLFTERIEVTADDKIVERLIAGRKRLTSGNKTPVAK